MPQERAVGDDRHFPLKPEHMKLLDAQRRQLKYHAEPEKHEESSPPLRGSARQNVIHEEARERRSQQARQRRDNRCEND